MAPDCVMRESSSTARARPKSRILTRREVPVRKHVGRLDVAVNHFVGVRRRQTFGNLPANAQRFCEGQNAFGLEPAIERLADQEFHGHERDAAIFPDLVKANDMVVLDLPHGAGLAQESLAHAFRRPSDGRIALSATVRRNTESSAL